MVLKIGLFMKKLIISIFVFIISCTVFAQNSAGSANHNTALRCLKLAENALVSGDWDNALRQAELGLAYDETVSDLIYVKAAARSNLGYSRAELLPVISKAFELNSWVGYSQNGARILYADLLSDTGDYEGSLSLLNSDPFILSADAEYIRIKDYYRMGTSEALENARSRVNTARRIYPQDSRFPTIFFMFENLIKITAESKNIDYVIPENVRIIADSYIAKLPNYNDDSDNLEIYAAFLANEETQQRLIKAISAKKSVNTPLLIIAQKKINMISDEVAFKEFFDSCNDEISLLYLDLFISLITDEDVKYQIVEKFTNWDGILYIDENLDYQTELTVEYSLGRPQYIVYDYNNDGVRDLFANCDFGSPSSLYYMNENKTEIIYDSYPAVKTITNNEKQYVFSFLNDDFTYTPFSMQLDKELQALELDFYIPYINAEASIPEIEDIMRKTSAVTLPIIERENATVRYTTLNGQMVFANFYEGNRNYAYCDFSTGLPFIRYVDYDNDGEFETSEIFDVVEENQIVYAKDRSIIEQYFNQIVADKTIFLKKVQIDRNSNTNYEFTEEYLSAGGKITTWDYDDNGLADSQFILYPEEAGEPLKEESIFFDSNGLPIVSLLTIDGTPMKMDYGQEEVMIYAGNNNHFYWIEEKQEAEIENQIIRKFNNLMQGAIEIVQVEDESYSLILIGKDYFCKKMYKIESDELLNEN